MGIKGCATGHVPIQHIYLGSIMKKLAVFLLTLAIFLNATQDTVLAAENENWTVMPAGAKSSYMGIHGGTMPVSLLVAADGSSLFTFVGRTGNDFMEVLKKNHLPLPSFGNATWSYQPRSRDAKLFAGNATASLPVIAVSGEMLMRKYSRLQPFGLSAEPLSIEGQLMKPQSFPHAKSLRTFFFPDYFSSLNSR